MKTLLIVLSMFASAQAMAAASDTFRLPRGTTGAYPLTRVSSVVSVQIPRCPRGATCAPISKLQITATLNSCVDELGPVTSFLEDGRDGKLHVYVAALGLSNPHSATVRCVAPALKIFTVNLGAGFREQDGVVLHMSAGRGTDTTASLAGALSLKPASVVSAEVVTPRPRPCRPGMPCPHVMPYTQATATVGLGCAQELGPITSQVERNTVDGKVDVYVTALVIQKPRRAADRCSNGVAHFTVPVAPGIYTDANVRLHFARSFVR